MNKKVFFDRVRANLGGGKLSKEQVAGMELILDTWETRYKDRTPPTQLAYAFATAWHETAKRMSPIAEYGDSAYFTRLYDIQGQNPDRARKMGNTKPGDGIKYRGRGLVQLTWYVNYARARDELFNHFNIRIDLINQPDLAMQPEVATLILLEGMEGGWFTGKDLDDFIDAKIDGDEHADFIKARKIINGTDKDKQIAGYADKFLDALTASLI